jgi:hypothetical protein
MIEYFLNDLGIIFHTHRVEYPKLLSAQVLPLTLRNLAIDRLKAIKKHVPFYRLCVEEPRIIPYTLLQIDDNINYLEAREQMDKWGDCVAFNHQLDLSRNQLSFEEVTPEFKPYV